MSTTKDGHSLTKNENFLRKMPLLMLPPVASSCREYVSQMWANLRAAEIAREVRRCAALVPSAWDVPEIVRQRVELKPDRVGVERATRKGCPFDLFLAFMYPA